MAERPFPRITYINKIPTLQVACEIESTRVGERQDRIDQDIDDEVSRTHGDIICAAAKTLVKRSTNLGKGRTITDNSPVEVDITAWSESIDSQIMISNLKILSAPSWSQFTISKSGFVKNYNFTISTGYAILQQRTGGESTTVEEVETSRAVELLSYDILNFTLWAIANDEESIGQMMPIWRMIFNTADIAEREVNRIKKTAPPPNVSIMLGQLPLSSSFAEHQHQDPKLDSISAYYKSKH